MLKIDVLLKTRSMHRAACPGSEDSMTVSRKCTGRIARNVGRRARRMDHGACAATTVDTIDDRGPAARSVGAVWRLSGCIRGCLPSSRPPRDPLQDTTAAAEKGLVVSPGSRFIQKSRFAGRLGATHWQYRRANLATIVFKSRRMSMTGNQGGVAPKGISHGARSVSRPIAATQMCAHVGLVATVVAATLPAGHWKLCAYALSGWHYLLYALAYRYGTVPMAMFRRDALVMKSVALIAFGVALRDALPAVPVLCAMAVGFALNAWAAAVLGWERTYYGHEIAGLPHAQVRRPPFAWTAHPMLYGNCVGFGTALLDEAFRARWAPLALLHLAANGALLWLEIHVRPLHGAFHRPWWLPAAGRGFALHNAILVGGALGAGAAVGWWVTRLPRLHDVNGPALGAAGAAYCLVTIVCYTSAGTTKHGYATP